MTTSSSSVAAVLTIAANGVAAPTVSDKPAEGATLAHINPAKTTMTDNEAETLTSAYKMLFGVLRTMRKGETDTDIPADYLTNADSMGALLGRAHRVFKSEAARRAKAERDAFAGKIDAIVQLALDKRATALKAFMSLPADIRADLPTPSATVSILVETIVESGVLGKSYDVVKAATLLHTMGYMVHICKEDGRRKDKGMTPPYLTATVGGSIRTNAAK